MLRSRGADRMLEGKKRREKKRERELEGKIKTEGPRGAHF